MTESEWLVSGDPRAMLNWETGLRSTQPGTQLARRASDRKLRLFACAAWRNRSMRFNAGPVRDGQMLVADAGERLADTLPVVDRPVPVLGSMTDFAPLVDDAVRAAKMLTDPLDANEAATQAHLLREIVGNPWRPTIFAGKGSIAKQFGSKTVLPRTYLTPTVLSLAHAAYDLRQPGGTLDPVRLAILADALTDAGCDNEEILRHLRGWYRVDENTHSENLIWVQKDRPHVRGCFVVDLLTGRE